MWLLGIAFVLILITIYFFFIRPNFQTEIIDNEIVTKIDNKINDEVKRKSCSITQHYDRNETWTLDEITRREG